MPVVDMSEVGVGGGSIAWADPAGMLRAGPDSAGADPGPVCFATGGERPTVTDAAVVTGIIAGRCILGTHTVLDADRAFAALGALGEPLRLGPLEAAVAVRGVASAEIAAAVQRQLFHRGIDPRNLTLFAFGGTGPLHAAEVAEIVGTPRVVVPRAAGVFTTFGLLSSEIGMECLEPTRIVVTGDGDRAEAVFAALEASVRALLGVDPGDDHVAIERSADVRFRHQVQTLALNLPPHPMGDRAVADIFRGEYLRQFGLTSSDDVEIVQLRARGISTRGARPRPRSDHWTMHQLGTKAVHLADGATSAAHLELVPGDGGAASVQGPAVVDFPHTSVTLPSRWRATVSGDGDLTLERTEG
jgi:N-methylhydantoinase A